MREILIFTGHAVSMSQSQVQFSKSALNIDSFEAIRSAGSQLESPKIVAGTIVENNAGNLTLLACRTNMYGKLRAYARTLRDQRSGMDRHHGGVICLKVLPLLSRLFDTTSNIAKSVSQGYVSIPNMRLARLLLRYTWGWSLVLGYPRMLVKESGACQPDRRVSWSLKGETGRARRP